MGKVSISRTNRGIKSGLENALALIGGLEAYINRTDKVMLKPNLNGAEGTTDLELTEGLIQLLQDYGCEKIVIAESTFGNGAITDMCFKKTGYDELAKKYGLEVINMNRSEVVDVPVRNPLIAESLKIAKEVFEADAIINLPVMKVHYATGVTLSLKNLKGMLVGREKQRFHEIGLDKAIVDLNNTIKPALNILDCITCMERMGPKGGDPVRLDLIIAGGNRAEVDYVGSSMMGYTLDEVKHLKLFAEVNEIDLAAVEQVGEPLSAVRYPFKKVVMEEAIPDGVRYFPADACSTCLNAMLLSCQMLEGVTPKKADLYLGAKHEAPAGDGAFSIAFGNCCKPREGEQFDGVVRGCPPFPFELKRVLGE